VKIALSNERGVEILSVTGPVVDHEAKILRAGITKILKIGKNKIIVELGGTPAANQDFSSDALREMAAFDVLARELSGRLVLGGVSPALRVKIEAFAKPPVVLCFATRKEAIDFLTAPPTPAKAETAPPAAAATSLIGAPAESGELASLHDEQNAMKTRLLQLETENKTLQEQVVLATIARRAPANEDTYQEKIGHLEAKIEKLLKEAADAAAAAPKKA
jgi:hypothetical protein